MVKINGKNIEAAGMTISVYLDNSGYDPKVVAVELNEEIVPKSSYGETVLKDGDVVEVVSFVGGG